MLAKLEPVEQILSQVKELSPEQRLRLIQQITETLMPTYVRRSTPLQYGKYRSGRMSTPADFAGTEWHPKMEGFYANQP